MRRTWSTPYATPSPAEAARIDAAVAMLDRGELRRYRVSVRYGKNAAAGENSCCCDAPSIEAATQWGGWLYARILAKRSGGATYPRLVVSEAVSASGEFGWIRPVNCGTLLVELTEPAQMDLFTQAAA